jgi:hypothetical protein
VQQVRRLPKQFFDQSFRLQIELLQAACLFALAQERGEINELFPHPFDVSVERNPWY